MKHCRDTQRMTDGAELVCELHADHSGEHLSRHPTEPTIVMWPNRVREAAS